MIFLRGNLLLLLTAFLWGTTFVAQLVGMDGIGPFTYCMSRFIIGFFVVLIIWRAFKGSRDRDKANGTYVPGWKFGLGAGCFMFVASAFQQFAMLFTTAGKTAFITCLYMILVPLFARLLGKKIRLENWLGAGVAVFGLYLLSVHGSFDLNYGDVLALIGSVFWAFHILFIDHFAEKADCIEISAAQLGMCAILNTIAAFGYESFTMQDIIDAAIPILYAAVLSSGVAFTLQIFGQKEADPASAAVIMSLESVFGSLAGWAVLNERMQGVEIFGCVLMLLGMLITQAGVILKRR